jgi:hypothetical protein
MKFSFDIFEPQKPLKEAKAIYCSPDYMPRFEVNIHEYISTYYYE